MKTALENIGLCFMFAGLLLVEMWDWVKGKL